MSVNASKAEKFGAIRDPLAVGTYPGRLVLVVDLGIQAQRPWGDKPKPPAPMVLLTYEFVDEFMRDEDGEEQKDKPRWLSEDFVLHHPDAERAKSTLRYQGLDPRNEHEGDFEKLLGVPCHVSIVLGKGTGKNIGKIYENVAAVSPMREKEVEECPPLVSEALCFDLDAPDIETFFKLPDWIQKRIVEGLGFADTAFGKEVIKQGDNKPAEKAETEGEVDEDVIPF